MRQLFSAQSNWHFISCEHFTDSLSGSADGRHKADFFCICCPRSRGMRVLFSASMSSAFTMAGRECDVRRKKTACVVYCLPTCLPCPRRPSTAARRLCPTAKHMPTASMAPSAAIFTRLVRLYGIPEQHTRGKLKMPRRENTIGRGMMSSHPINGTAGGILYPLYCFATLHSK
jgi:hypothetical protein